MASQQTTQNSWKELAGTAAATLVEDGMFIGLGTGSTADYLIRALAQRMQQGLRLAGAVPSSLATKELALQLGIPITDLDAHPDLDLYIDGADEIDPELRLLKGAGGALLREKIVASAARRFIVIADVTKKVTLLGSNFPVPVETVPFAATLVRKRLAALGLSVQLRQREGKIFVTDNGNFIFDCTFPNGIADPVALHEQLHHIVGVIETGLFIHMAQQAIIGGPGGVEYLP